MATKFYFHAASSTVSNLPTTTQSGLTINGSVDAQSVNRTMTPTIGTSQTSLALTTNATASAQNYYFTRFVSAPLGAVTISPTDNWTVSIASQESNASANFPSNSSATVNVTLYVWRPSTQTVVGTIINGASGGAIAEAGLTQTAGSYTFLGPSSSITVLSGDVLCFEVLYTITQAAATSYTDTWFYDGTTEASTTSCASFISCNTNTITPLGTKLFFHDAASSISGTLPTTQQGAYATPKVTVDAYTVNRSMNTTIGTAQVTKTSSLTASTANTVYFTKFVSQALNTTSIAADTWNYSFACLEQTISVNFPVTTTGAVNVTVYVWRPSSGTKVGTISDGASSGTAFAEPNAANAERSCYGTFTGSAVTCQVGDVIIMEVYFAPPSVSGSTVTANFYYDGTTENTNNNTAVTNHASFIQSPGQVLAFSVGVLTTRSISETLGLSEAKAIRITRVPSVAESVTFAETLVKRGITRKTPETVTLAEARTATPRRVRTASEALALAETSIKRKITRKPAETLSLAESIAALRKFKRAISETLGLAESRTLKVIRKIIDAVTLTETSVSALKFLAKQYFNGTNNSLVKQGETASSEVTWSYWIRAPTTPIALGVILVPGGRSMIHYQQTDGTVAVNTYYHDGTNVQYVSANLADGNWHHILHTHSNVSNNTYVYVDGTQVYNNAKVDYLASSGTTKLFFGAENDGSDNPINPWGNGELDDLRIYNTQLTSAEALYMYKGGDVLRGKQVHWRFDENTGTTSKDVQGGIVGTLVNGASWYTASLPPIDAETIRLTESISAAKLLGHLYSYTVNETIALAELVKRKITRKPSVAETIALAEAAAAKRLFKKSLAETIALAEAKQPKVIRKASETIALAETLIKRKITRKPSETLTLAEAVTKIPRRIRSIAETIALAEPTTIKRKITRKPSETLSLLEVISIGGHKIISIVETITLTEAIAAKRKFKRTIAETVSLVEVRTRRTIPRITETISLAESIVKRPLRRFSIAETITLAETSIKRKITRKPVEAITLVESIIRRKIIRKISDTVSLLESVVATKIRSGITPEAISETLGLAESKVRKFIPYIGRVIYVVNIQASLNLSESLTKKQKPTVQPENLSLSESLTRKVKPKTITETLHLVEVSVRRPIRRIAETITLNDAIKIGGKFEIMISESIHLTETVAKKNVRKISESLILTESKTRKILHSIAESLLLSELFGRKSKRTAKETLHLTEDHLHYYTGLGIPEHRAERFQLVKPLMPERIYTIEINEQLMLSEQVGTKINTRRAPRGARKPWYKFVNPFSSTRRR